MSSLAKLPVLDAFKWRHSVRNFGPEALNPKARLIVEEAVAAANECEVPFRTGAFVKDTFETIGTFGFVKNAKGAVIVAAPKPDLKNNLRHTLIDAGVRGQAALMHLASHKIGTVWLAGSFRKAHCDAHVKDRGESVAAIPFGLGEVAPGLVQRLVKWGAQSAKRRALSEMFFDVERARRFTEENAGELLPMLKALQSGPSATNQQPWRFLVDGRNMHVFCAKDATMAMLDMGLAIANAQVLARGMNHQPKLSFQEGVKPALGGFYVCSCSFRD